jgi:ABC-type lipoprotein export system ATPase subunit
VILADEPTGNLDTKSSDQVVALLRELVDQRGTTVVAVTHSMEFAHRMDRHIELVDGRIVADTGNRHVPAV